MIRIVCPSCGESARELLKPERQGESIFITCLTCGHVWQRHPDDCPQCGKRALTSVRKPLIEKARGTQQSIIGYRIDRVGAGLTPAPPTPPDVRVRIRRFASRPGDGSKDR